MNAEKEGRSLKAVRSKAQSTRLQAIHSQLTSALRFCSTAENALIVGKIQLGHDAVEKARHTAQVVRAHLKEPNHVPADCVAGVREQLGELEKRISTIQGGCK